MKLHKSPRNGGGCELALALLSVVLAACAARADVYGKARLWMRGMGEDANGNGVFDAGERRDALGGTWMDTGRVLNAAGVVFTNEVVNMPYRGVARTMQTLYFPQPTVVTNENGWGYLNSSSFHIGALAKACMTDVAEDAHYAFAVRFRPDLTQPHTNYSWVVSVGHSKEPKRGIMVGFGAKFERSVTSGGVTATHQLARPHIFYGGTMWQPASDKKDNSNNAAEPVPFISMGEWNDLVLSVDGRTMTLLVSRGNHNTLDSDSAKAFTSKFMTTVVSFTVGDASNLAPGDNGLVRFASEEARGADGVAWDSTYTAASHNEWKHFRGSIQSFAIWTNSLTVAEMREAAAWPRTDIWRVGVENGTVDEFGGGADAADADADRWNLPKSLASGDSATVRFPLDKAGEAEMNELFTVKATPDSGAGTLRVAVNGGIVGTVSVAPGAEKRLFVLAKFLAAGATNTLTVTRCDSGADALKIDAMWFGGSLQYGKRDNSFLEFVREYDAPASYDLVGGNWRDGRRIIFAQGATAGNLQYTNIVVKFRLPADLVTDRYGWTLSERMKNANHTLRFALNGTEIGRFASGDNDCSAAIPDGLLAEENELHVSNVGTGSAYVQVDYIRLELAERRGLTLLLR